MLEIRTVQVVPVINPESKKIIGYAAKFNTRSKLIQGAFIETIAPGAFKHSLDSGRDIKALINHDPSRLLGTRANKTLTVAEDGTGLYFEVDPPDTSYARDLRTLMERGDISECSFAFRCVSDSWRMEDGVPLRTLKDVDVGDVSIVTDPAYAGTEAKLRSYEEFRERQAYLSLLKMRLEIASRL